MLDSCIWKGQYLCRYNTQLFYAAVYNNRNVLLTCNKIYVLFDNYPIKSQIQQNPFKKVWKLFCFCWIHGYTGSVRMILVGVRPAQWAFVTHIFLGFLDTSYTRMIFWSLIWKIVCKVCDYILDFKNAWTSFCRSPLGGHNFRVSVLIPERYLVCSVYREWANRIIFYVF